MYIHLYIYICSFFIFIYIYIFTLKRGSLFLRYSRGSSYIHICICTYVHLNAYICILTYVCICAYTHIYTNVHLNVVQRGLT